jgi:hypothetical protein
MRISDNKYNICLYTSVYAAVYRYARTYIILASQHDINADSQSDMIKFVDNSQSV